MEQHSLVSYIDAVPTFSMEKHSLISAHLFHGKHSLISDIDAVPPYSMEKHSLNIVPTSSMEKHILVGDIDAVPPFSMEKHSFIDVYEVSIPTLIQ